MHEIFCVELLSSSAHSVTLYSWQSWE